MAFTTPWFNVLGCTVQDMPGTDGDQLYYSLKPPDYVSVLAVTPDRQVLLVRQFRPAVDAYTLELPSGHVEPHETPEQAGHRELTEETGFIARSLEHLGTLNPDTGRLSNRLWCYLARDVRSPADRGVPEEGLELVTYPLDELWSLIADGTFDHAINLATVALAVVRRVNTTVGPPLI